MAQKAQRRFGKNVVPGLNIHFLISAAGGETRHHTLQLERQCEYSRRKKNVRCMQSCVSVCALVMTK